MPKITGKDIYSIEEWNIILSHSKYDKSNKTIQALSQAISNYHALNKKDKNMIPARQKLLEDIKILSEKLINERDKDFHHKSDKHRKNKEDTIDYWVSSLQKKANNKILYLDKLNEFLAHAKLHHIDREKMIEHLKIRNDDNTPLRLKLFSGTYLEKIDPLHRQFEFNMKGLANKKSGMNQAFIDWVQSNENTPFFLWLEGHDILKINRVIANTEKIALIEYDLKDAHLVSIKENQNNCVLVSKSKNRDDQESVLNTRNLKNYSFKMGTAYSSVAFVWSKDNENQFITHPHEAGKYHHSSLTSGRSVRCAGMWIVKDGIVTHISNSSGHYRPSSLSFYLLIKFLQNKNLINENTKVADLRKPEELLDPSKPFGGQKSPYIVLSEYLVWAESQAEIKSYLQSNSNSVVQEENYRENKIGHINK